MKELFKVLTEIEVLEAKILSLYQSGLRYLPSYIRHELSELKDRRDELYRQQERADER